MYVMENDQDSKDYQFPDTTAEMLFFEQLGGVDFVETDEQQEDEQQQPPQTVYHVYMVKEPDPTDTPLVVEQSHPPQKRKTVVLFIGIPVIATLLGLAAGLLWPILFAPTVTVTLFPTQQTMTTTQTITLIPGAPRAPTELHSRSLPTLTLSQQQTTKTTGQGHQPSQQAHGFVTLYNALPAAQFVDAGTLIVSQTGIQIVTDQDASIPAAVMPTEGQATIHAHAVAPGLEGNMQAGAINGACCRANIFARNNSSFTGGALAREYPMVTQHDLDTVEETVKQSLQQSIQAAIATQVKPEEAFVMPPSCNPIVNTDHPVNTEASSVTVTVSLSCRALAYNKQALLELVKQQQTTESTKQLGTGYILTGDLQPTITSVTTKQDTLIITVEEKGVWSYQFTTEQLHQLSQQIAGKTRVQATSVLLQTSGISKVSLGEQITSLPTDSRNIQIAVMYEAA